MALTKFIVTKETGWENSLYQNITTLHLQKEKVFFFQLRNII